MEKLLKKNNILKGAGVLLIAAVMILSTVVVAADTDDGQKQKYTLSRMNNTQTPKDRDVILFESFEDNWVADSDGDLAPPGWENHILNTAGTTLPTWWGQVGTVSFASGDVVPPDGDFQAMVYWDYGDQDEWIITPEITLEDNAEISFEFYGHYGSTYGDHYYVKVSPTGGYEKTDFTDEIWDASTEPEQDNHYDFPVVLDLSSYDGMTIRIAWQDWAIGGLWYAHVIDAVNVTSGGEPPSEPNLDCTGSLTWTDVEPGATVTGNFTVENAGDPLSLLNWEIDTYPEWGTWTFDPESGDGLTPEAGAVIVDVEVVAPDESETEFTGEVKIVNSEDPDDFCIIDVSLATPVSQGSDGLFGWVWLRGLVFNPREDGSRINARAINLHYIEISPEGLKRGVVRLKTVSFQNGVFIKMSEKGLLGNAVRVSGFCHGAIEIQ